MGHQVLAQGQGFLALHGAAVDHERPQGDVVVLVPQLLHLGDGEGAHEVVEHLVLGREVDRQVVPLLGRQAGQPPLHDRLVGRDDLHDGGPVGREVLADGADQGRRLEAGEEAGEEALLAALEGREGGGGGHARFGLAVLVADADRLQGGAQVLMDHLVGVGPGVPDGDVLVAKFVTDRLVLHAVEGQGARHVEAERLQLSGDQLHGRHAALLAGLHEVFAARERRLGAAPEAEP